MDEMAEYKATGAIKKKKNLKKHKKDLYSWENVIKDIDNSDSPAIKLQQIENKYKDLHEQYMNINELYKNMQRDHMTLEMEKCNLTSELTRIELSKSRIENLARELQKQNKEIKAGILIITC